MTESQLTTKFGYEIPVHQHVHVNRSHTPQITNIHTVQAPFADMRYRSLVGRELSSGCSELEWVRTAEISFWMSLLRLSPFAPFAPLPLPPFASPPLAASTP